MTQDNNFAPNTTIFTGTKSFDQGLRTHMIRVFNTVGGGLAVSGLVAWLVAHTPALSVLLFHPLSVIMMAIGMIAFLYIGFNPNRILSGSVASAQIKYYVFTSLFGASMAYLFLIYSSESLARVFFITAATFFATSLYGYTTKRDLTGWGSFLMMGVIGILLASLVNIFLRSPGLYFVISWIGVLAFTGLTAFDVQNAKRFYASSAGDDTNKKLAILSAIGLYINFVNLFQFLLSIFGNRR